MSNTEKLGVVKSLTKKLTTPKSHEGPISFDDTDILMDGIINSINETTFNQNNKKPRVPIMSNTKTALTEIEKLGIEKMVENELKKQNMVMQTIDYC